MINRSTITVFASFALQVKHECNYKTWEILSLSEVLQTKENGMIRCGVNCEENERQRKWLIKTLIYTGTLLSS